MTWPAFAAPERLVRLAAAWPWRRSARAEPSLPDGCVEVAARAELGLLREWRNAFADLHKDHRYYELVEDTLAQGFEYRYFVVRDAHGGVLAIQPFLLLDQDLLAGAGPGIGALAGRLRRGRGTSTAGLTAMSSASAPPRGCSRRRSCAMRAHSARR